MMIININATFVQAVRLVTNVNSTQKENDILFCYTWMKLIYEKILNNEVCNV